MPPHLHPRSRMTSSLFASTVVACFMVVALPHVLPCPAPKTTKFADGSVDVDSRRRIRRQQQQQQLEAKRSAGFVNFSMDAGEDGSQIARASRRGCPVPKPGGILGEWLGFHSDDGDDKSLVRRMGR
ncbi:cytochrome c oxidase assembly factor 2 [Geosmithia morbida]|uniref:Cytochrome c oxidase assembly factor 2 n=1 Tax=Geosmithia morbida TaxID=1094350 RepID=A0A9P5D9T0_9HYPO|nr:cytochrome c oxidase assembly factor 2 [Geosmithia morbida]KAF4126844.1 cytochrome c oxidase assembly factor 2 [Geosmithia morbida]